MKGFNFLSVITLLFVSFSISAQPNIHGASCSDKFCVSVGAYGDDHNTPNEAFLLKSADSDLIWHLESSLPSLTNKAIFKDVSCSTEVCVVIGWDTQPFLMVNAFDDAPWQIITDLEGVNANATLHDVSCNKTLCVVVGKNPKGDPLILQSPDAGQHWTHREAINGLPNDYVITSIDKISCKPEICVAIGKMHSSTDDHPAQLVIQSTDDGRSWDYVFIASGDAMLDLTAVSCSAKICAVVGRALIPERYTKAKIYITSDQGITWRPISPPALWDRNVSFYDVTCGNKTCVAAGNEPTGSLMLETVNAGISWQIITFPNVPSFTNLQTNCSRDYCAATGLTSSNQESSILLANKFGQTAWKLSTHASEAFTGVISQTACSDNRCIGVGRDATDQVQVLQSWKATSWARVNLQTH